MNPLFSEDELTQLIGTESLAKARNALDVESISRFHYDVRGRLEGAVKPASLAQVGASFARITRRGSMTKLECHVCGKGAWCIHTAMLVLHHLGIKPSYKPVAVSAAKPSMGIDLCATFASDGAQFALRNRSNGQSIRQPLTFLRQQPKSALNLPDLAREMLLECASDDPLEAHCLVERSELSSLLQTLAQTALLDLTGQPYQWLSRHGEPRIRVALRQGGVDWQCNDDPIWQQTVVWVPGRPGYFVDGLRIVRNLSGYTPDFQGLVPVGQLHGKRELDAKWLLRLMAEKHLVEWQTAKPVLIEEPDSMQLVLQAQGSGLRAKLQLAHGNRSFDLKETEAGVRLLKGATGYALTQISPIRARQIERQKARVKAPWQGSQFRVRASAAAEFLSRTQFPDDWLLDRREVDRWFGLESAELDLHWNESGEPVFRIDGETYDIETLRQGTLGPDLIALPDGRKARVDTSIVRHSSEMLRAASIIHREPDQRVRLLARIRGEVSEATTPLDWDESTRTKLRGYQQVGVEWLHERHQQQEPALLADDMGLGKTVQTLVYLQQVKSDHPQLIVVPRSLLHNWQQECLRFTPDRTLKVHHGNKRDREPESLQTADLVCTTYGTVRADIDLFADVHFQVVVLDEAQAIKNPDSQTSLAVRELWADQRVALSGTPIENRLDELWSLFEFFAPGYLGERDQLKHIHYAQSFHYRLIRDLVSPFMLRRLKSDVVPELPEREDILVRMALSDAQQSVYDKTLRGARRELGQDLKRAKPIHVLTQLLRLRQVCCHPGLVDEAWVRAESSKFSFLIERLEAVVAAGHAALIFSQFTQLLKLLAFELEERDLGYHYLDGSTSNRQTVVDAFQDGGQPLFLISLKAGGLGLNLTRASYVFILDPWWNPMVERQATDRAHRIGQTQPVTTYRLVAKATVEERILDLQSRKSDLADALWDESGSLLSTLSDSDLQSLFS